MSELTEVVNLDRLEDVRRSFRREKKTKLDLEQKQVCGWRQVRGWRWSWGASRCWGENRGWGRGPCPGFVWCQSKKEQGRRNWQVEEPRTRMHIIDDGSGCQNWPKWGTVRCFEDVTRSFNPARKNGMMDFNRFRTRRRARVALRPKIYRKGEPWKTSPSKSGTLHLQNLKTQRPNG